MQAAGMEGDQPPPACARSGPAPGAVPDPKTGHVQTSLFLLVPQPGGGAWPEEFLLLVELAAHNSSPPPAEGEGTQRGAVPCPKSRT